MWNKLWYGDSLFAWCLLPLSWLYRTAVCLRRYYYDRVATVSVQIPVPVIVIGNLTVGGVGKTPLVAYLAQQLKARGLRPGLISRGYAGQAEQWPQTVTADSDARLVGDEPLWLVCNTGCPMVVAPNRVQAVQQLLKQSRCDVIISDDGLQHYALPRDIEVLVIDGERRFGNQHCLPAGPLREPVSRLQHIPYRVCNGGVAQQSEIAMQLVPGAIYRVADPARPLMPEDIRAREIHALCGIGHPQRFFNTLRRMGFRIIEHVFADHHHYSYTDIDIEGDVIIIMTEKDAVKCRAIADRRHYCLPVTVNANITPLISRIVAQCHQAKSTANAS